MLAYADRACGLCMEQLLLLYGTMLFVQREPLRRETPRTMASDLEVFEQLLGTLCATVPASLRRRAERHLRLLEPSA